MNGLWCTRLSKHRSHLQDKTLLTLDDGVKFTSNWKNRSDEEALVQKVGGALLSCVSNVMSARPPTAGDSPMNISVNKVRSFHQNMAVAACDIMTESSSLLNGDGNVAENELDILQTLLKFEIKA